MKTRMLCPECEQYIEITRFGRNGLCFDCMEANMEPFSVCDNCGKKFPEEHLIRVGGDFHGSEYSCQPYDVQRWCQKCYVVASDKSTKDLKRELNEEAQWCGYYDYEEMCEETERQMTSSYSLNQY